MSLEKVYEGVPFVVDLKSVVAADTVQQFIMSNYLYNHKGHSHLSYFQWRFKRISKILEFIDVKDLKNFRILDVGGGYGYVGAFFAELGAKVISVDGRKYNSNLANIIHRNLENYTSICLDVNKDREDFVRLGNFDFIICFGFLEILNHIEPLIAALARMTRKVFCEAIVVDSIDPNYAVHISYTDYSADEYFDDHPIGSREATIFSPYYVEQAFAKYGYTKNRLLKRELNTENHLYDWEHQNSGKVQMNPCLRRFWIFDKP